MNTQDKPWILTDPDTEQYGRKLSDWVYEFKEKTKDDDWMENDFVELEIDMSKYSANQVEPIINAYGYTLEPWSDGTFIFDLYKNKETVNWIIAECIFENESGNY